MKRILAPILLLTLLFPALAQGQSLNDWVGKGKGIPCETTGMGCPESVDAKDLGETMDDLVEREGIFYKKFTEVPFTGKTTGRTQGSFKKGKRDGPWVIFYNDGFVNEKLTGTFKNGKKNGPWVSYNVADGQLSSKGTFKNGKKDGPWVTYSNNRQLSFKGTYKDGKRDGLWVGFHQNGNVNEKVTGTFKNGKKNGPWIIYHDNGQLQTKGTWKDGKKDGLWISYHDNGQLKYKGTLKDSKRDGPWVGYNKDGTVWDYYTGTYKNGVKVK